MGGATSEVSATTRRVLLEAAAFDPVSIRRTSKRLGLIYLHLIEPDTWISDTNSAYF
jgi:hypothetical protein